MNILEICCVGIFVPTFVLYVFMWAFVWRKQKVTNGTPLKCIQRLSMPEYPMTALQADVAAVKELVKLAHRFKQCVNIATPDYMLAKQELLSAVEGSVPAIERLLGIVSAVEKLEAEWRDYRETGISRDGENYVDGYNESLDDCADDLKRLLHPEDK